MATAKENVGQAQKPKRSKVFLIIHIALVVSGTWFGITKWHQQSGNFILGKTTSSFVTSDDFTSEHDAKAAAEKMIRTL